MARLGNLAASLVCFANLGIKPAFEFALSFILPGKFSNAPLQKSCASMAPPPLREFSALFGLALASTVFQRIRAVSRTRPENLSHQICEYLRAAIAQLGERQTEDLKVPGSIPGLGSI